MFLMAIYEKRIELVEMVLHSVKNKAKLLSQRDIYGNSPLHLAVIQNSQPLIRLLLTNGASREAINKVSY